uniref:Uncharacterized protein n=1 Tax=Peronospora matthiolae TaxID=2874970 RepID=A0AAV1VF54_9STRA
MSSPTRGTSATVSRTGFDRRDGVAAGDILHGFVDPFARQREQAVVGQSRRVVDELVHEVHDLRDRVARLEKQVGLTLRVPRLVEAPTPSAQAPRDPPRRIKKSR